MVSMLEVHHAAADILYAASCGPTLAPAAVTAGRALIWPM